MKQFLAIKSYLGDRSMPLHPVDRQKKTLSMMLLGFFLGILFVLLSMVILDLFQIQYPGRNGMYISGIIALIGIIIIALIQRYFSTMLACSIFTGWIFIVTVLADTPAAFISGQSIIFLIFPLILAGTLLRPWAGYVVAVILNVGLIIGYIILGGNLPNIPAMVLFFIIAWTVHQSTSNLERAVKQEEQKSHALAKSEEAITKQNHHIQEISRTLLQVQEREKRILSAELHDDLGQSLTSLKLMLELIEKTNSPNARQKKISDSRELVSELMNKVRNLSLDLRPAMLDDFGLFPALRWLFDLYSSRTGIHIQTEYDHDCIQRFEPHVETAAFRIIQEALTNVARHACVKEARVRISFAKDLSIEVTDKGTGFDLVRAMQSTSTCAGLSGMQERARLLGGTVVILSTPSIGTQVIARLPLGDNSN